MPTGNSGLYKGTKGAKKAAKEEAKVKKVKEPKTKVEKTVKEEEVKKPVKEVKPKKDDVKKDDVKKEVLERVDLEGELLKLFLDIEAANTDLDTVIATSKGKLKELIFDLINVRNNYVLFSDKINGMDENTKKTLDLPIDALGNNILRISNMITALQGVSRIISDIEGKMSSVCLGIDGD